jgi:hypothetical protein
MKDRINSDPVHGRLIENLERESPDKRSAELVHCNWIELGMPLYAEHARLHATQEILAQPRFASLVPTVSVCDVLLGLRCVNDAINHVALAPAA